MSEEKVFTQNYGEIVVCDFCNGGEQTMGGCLIGSNAVCGDCCESHGYYEADDIDEIFNSDKTFTDNVIAYRKRVYGSGDLIITIQSF